MVLAQLKEDAVNVLKASFHPTMVLAQLEQYEALLIHKM